MPALVRRASSISYERLFEHGRQQSFKRMKRSARLFVKILKKAVASDPALRSAKAIAITLTFRDMAAFKQCKERKPRSGFAQFMRNLTQYIERKGVRVLGYGAVIETQARGVPHYHILLVVSKYIRLPKPDKWIWKYGSSSISSLGSVNRLSVNYLVKYLQKPAQKGWATFEGRVMNGDTGRWQVNDPLYGVKKFIWVLRLPDWREVFRWLRLPDYIRRFSYFFKELPKKISGAGWFFDQAKVLLMTDARVLFHAGGTETYTEGHFFVKHQTLERAPATVITFISANFIGILEGVDRDFVENFRAMDWHDRIEYGLWFPIDAEVETVLTSNAGMGYADILKLPLVMQV